MATMLAARLHKIGEAMRLEQVPVPQPRPTDVLVAVRACGVVPNLINVLTHWQTWFPKLPLPGLPAIFGLDVAGEIAAVGEQVQNFRKGDRVYVNPGLFCGSCPACRADETMNCTNYTFSGYFGFGPDSQKQFDAYPYGGMCEYMIAPQHNLVALPKNVSYEERFGVIPTFAALAQGVRQMLRRVERHFRRSYREAFGRWQRGARDVVFPHGTWGMAVVHGLLVGPPS